VPFKRRFRTADHELLRQLRLQRLGDRRHAAEIRQPLVVDPVPQLLDAERRFPDRRHLRTQFGAVHPDQIPPPVRQLDSRRIEQRRLGQDPRAIRC